MDHPPQPASQYRLDQLNQAVARAKKLGYKIRSEWLGGSAAGWCEVGGKRLLFIDLSLSIDEQLEQVEAAIEAASQSKSGEKDVA